MVVISSVVSVISFSALGLIAELVVSSIARSLCFSFNFVWFRRCLLFVCLLIDCVFAGVSCVSLPLDAWNPADFAVCAIFPLPIFGSLPARYSFSISRCSCLICDFLCHPPRSSWESPPFPTRSAWGTQATFATTVRSKTITNPTMLARWHAIDTKASIHTARHRSFSFSSLVNDCSNRELTAIVSPLTP